MSQQIQITGGAKVRNLEGVLTGTAGVVNALGINVPSGIPQLDNSGKILVSQLPNSVMEYKGTWNAATNTPTLVNGTGNQGDVYLCNVAGTVDFGAGPIVFFVGDQVIYSGTIWQRASGASGTVTSVAVTESGDALTITGSPITTSGTINIGFAGTSGQYINGAGGLTSFPSLTGFVPYTGATANLDLGTFNLTADVITGATGSFASSGGSNTFDINHSSGSGIALNITKGGNGEGLYINKTSGSGNAATIVGNLGGTSATFSSTLGVTGALNGTTASFTGSLTAQRGNFNQGASSGYAISMKNRNANQEWGLIVDTDAVDDKNLGLYSSEAAMYILRIAASTGAATFFSRITSNNSIVVNRVDNGDYLALKIENRPITAGNTASGFIAFYSNSGDATNDTYSSGRIYSRFDTNSYNSARISLATVTGNEIYQDVLTAKDTNVGIGTINPAQTLHLFTTSATGSGVGTAIQIQSAGIGANQAWVGVNKGTGNGLTFSVENNSIIFNTGASTPFGGTERFRINSTDAVFTNPLSVITNDNNFAFNVQLRNNNTGTQALTGLGLSDSSNVRKGQVLWVPSNYVTASLRNSFLVSSVTNVPLILCADATGADTPNIKFQSGAQDKMVMIGSSGNFGIGTSSPKERFEIAGLTANIRLYGRSGVAQNQLSSNLYYDGTTWVRDNNSFGAVAIQLDSTSGNLIFNTTATTSGFPAERMRITSVGNVGIGITPSAWDNSVFRVIQIGSSIPAFLAGRTDSFANVQLGVNAFFDGSWKYVGNDFATRYFQTAGGHAWQIAPSGTAGNAITFTQAMTLDASGNLGIGTSSPTATLQIGDGTANSFMRIRALDGGAIVFNKGANNASFIGDAQAGLGSGDGLMLYTYSGTARPILFYPAGVEAMRITSTGNVGIGTSSPDSLLEVSKTDGIITQRGGTGWSIYRSYGGDGSTANLVEFQIRNRVDGSNMVSIGNFSNHDLTLRTNNAERMRITSGGNVLVNTTTATAASINTSGTLQVNSEIMSVGSSAGLFWTNRAGGVTSNSNWYGWYTSAGTIFLWNGSSNIAQINASNGTYTALSNKNKKKDFEQSTIGLDAILGLKPTLYRMKSDDTEGNKELGFIAQEVKEFIPQAYVESEDFIGLNYNAIAAALVKSVQELEARIKQLENK